MRVVRTGRPAGLLPVLATVLAVVGCGPGERTFEAQEFVEEANANGAGLELGEPLISTEADVSVYSLHISELPTGEGGLPAGGGHEEIASGALTLLPDAEAGREEYERCETAVSLICYRAANVSLSFEGLTPEQRARLDAAITAMASD